MSNHIPAPKLTLSMFAPKFWPAWIGILFLFLMSWLPYKFQAGLGTVLGRLFYRLGGSRVHTVRRNVEICFPELTADEQEKMVKQNLCNTGVAMFESGMGWFWPDWRVRRHTVDGIIGEQHILDAQKKGQGIYLLAYHFVTMELGNRIIGLNHQCVAFYRPHNNPVIDYFMYRGRARACKYLVAKRNVRGFMRALRSGEMGIYLPDQDYGKKSSLFVPFFGVEQTATTLGTLTFAKQPNCKILSTSSYRDPKTGKYSVIVTDGLDGIPSEQPTDDLTRINKQVEEHVRLHPDQYLWAHRRFKTRPENEASLY